MGDDGRGAKSGIFADFFLDTSILTQRAIGNTSDFNQEKYN